MIFFNIQKFIEKCYVPGTMLGAEEQQCILSYCFNRENFITIINHVPRIEEILGIKKFKIKGKKSILNDSQSCHPREQKS